MARRGGRGVSRRGWALALLALAPTLLCCVSAAREPANVAVGDVAPAAVQSWTAAPQLPQANNARDGAPLQARDSGAMPLRLCECERATGAPNGLSCSDKVGWFVSSFERQVPWVAGGGYVPLSHAICCRPCLPGELPPDPSGRIPGQAPLAVISLGCHASTDVLPGRCEAEGSSFVAGYSEAVNVFSTPDMYYPINTAQCCTPALLLENGDTWELERCECRDAPDPDFPVNCGGTNTDELLLGFIFFRLSPLGHVVPVGPAQCCKACLSGTVHPMNLCDDLNACSGHGVCNMRSCECFDGWTGADCSQMQGGGKNVPPWAIALIVLSSSALAGVFIIAAGYALQALGVTDGSGSDDGDGDERQPLLIRIDADDAGSVGSADTSDGDDDVDVEEVERRVTQAIQRLGRAAGAPAAAAAGAGAAAAAAAAGEPAAGEGDEAEQAATPGAEAAAASAEAAGDAAAASDAAAAEPAAAPPAAAEPAAPEPVGAAAGAAAPAAAEAVQEAAAAAAEDDEPHKPARCGPIAEGPLAMVDCSVCMSRPVQVAVVPCGHCCMCRRCSRRLNRCPICRKEIARRQRLFV